MFTLSRRKQSKKILYKSKRSRCTTVISHVNSNESNHLNTSNSDFGIGTSNLPHINVHNYSPFNSLIALQKVTDTESSFSINNETTDEKNISEEILSHQNLSEIIDHTCDYNGINLVNTEGEADVTFIYSINATNDMSMNDDDTYTHKY